MSNSIRFLFIALFAFITVEANAQAPQLINFQAQIEGMPDGTVPVTFSIYNAPSGQTPLWTESQSVSAPDGIIQVLLGGNTPFPENLFNSDGDRYLELQINGETLSPRFRLTSVAYALRASVADDISGNLVSTLNNLEGEVNIVAGENVSVTPDGQDIIIAAAGGGTSDTTGIQAINEGNGITVENPNGPTATVNVADNSINDDFIVDNSLTENSLATNSVGSDELQSQIELGPSGNLTVANGSNQVVTSIGENDGGGTVFVKQSNGGFDAAALTVRTTGDGSGLGGQLQLRGNPNWDAIQMFSDGETQGGRVLLREPAPGNPLDAYTTLAFRGQDAKGQIIVLSDNDGFINIGGSLQEIKSRGRMGLGLTLNEYDSDSPLSTTLFVRGDANITGNVFKPTSVSAIDHPLDPQNMVLSHSEVISNEMLTIYHGTVTLDQRGEAWVELPEWFESMNKDFHYQLTCIGGYSRVYIAEKIADNRFKIAGGQAGLEVSWQVTAVRHDPYAQQNPVIVETGKKASEIGTYLHPEAYGVTENQ